MFWEKIERKSEITIKFRDKDFKEITAVFDGLQARALQHEIQHMNGELVVDSISLMKKQMWLKKLSKRGLDK